MSFKAINEPFALDAEAKNALRRMTCVLEGRERVAGGATTGSCGVPSVLSRRAPAGAREACGDTTSPSSARFSRPSRALPSSTMGDRVDPVVAPPANFSRASGTRSQLIFPFLAPV
jgi:hypothetical protein